MASSKKQEQAMLARGYITVREAARRLRQGVGAVYRAIERGDLKVEQVNKTTYVELESFKALAGLLADEPPPVEEKDEVRSRERVHQGRRGKRRGAPLA